MQVPGTRTRRAKAAPGGTGRLDGGPAFALAAAAAAFCASLVGWCSLAEAASGAVHSRSAVGIKLDVDTRWVDGSGYRPVRITVTPTATTTDRTLTVEILFRRNWVGDYDLSVRRDVEIPAGAGPANAIEATLSVPQRPAWTSYAINVSEDGRLHPGLSTRWAAVTNPVTEWAECFPAMLFVVDKSGAAPPNTSQLTAPLPVYSFYANQPARPVGQFAGQLQGLSQLSSQLPSAIARTTAELPGRWIEYSSLDVVCLSVGQLRELAREHPLRLRALVEWTATGGNLWVHGVGEEWQRIGSLEKLVGLAPGPGDAKAPTARPDRGWTRPDPNRYGRPIHGTLSASGGVDGRYVEALAVELGADEADVAKLLYDDRAQPSDARPPERPHFLLREYDLGLIVAFAEDPFPGTKADWSWVLAEVGPERWAWYQRHGMSTLRENPDYWKFLIPGVGLVPVTQFCVLITLFVVGIGPLNYWLVRRWRRLYLLVVTIPFGAATATFLLVAYALVADGLSTRVRVRSVTRLDERRGQATCWARLSYYAGLAPGQGLRFPDDIAVLPLEHLPVPGYEEGPMRREVIWGRKDQWFASGWLASRTPVQYLTVRSRPTGLRLVFDPEKLEVENRLGTPIQQVLVRSFKGEYYWASGVGRDATAAVRPIGQTEAWSRLHRTYRDHQPALPEIMQGQYYGRTLGPPFPNYSTRRYANSAIVPPTQETSRLEMTLARLFRDRGSRPEPGTTPQEGRVPAGIDAEMLEPGSYVAVVDTAVEVDPGTPASEEASFHVILGNW